MTETAIRSHADALVADGAPAQPPYPEWLDERRAADALRDSWKTKVFARERLAR
jgi:hypothetical protein